MARYDIEKLAVAVLGLAPVAITTDTTTVGLTVDLAGFEGCKVAVATGVLTDGNYAVAIYEGDESDMSDEAAVAAADRVGDLPNFADDTDDAQVQQFGYTGKKRYIRIKIVSDTTTNGALITAVVVKGKPRHAE